MQNGSNSFTSIVFIHFLHLFAAAEDRRNQGPLKGGAGKQLHFVRTDGSRCDKVRLFLYFVSTHVSWGVLGRDSPIHANLNDWPEIMPVGFSMEIMISFPKELKCILTWFSCQYVWYSPNYHTSLKIMLGTEYTRRWLRSLKTCKNSCQDLLNRSPDIFQITSSSFLHFLETLRLWDGVRLMSLTQSYRKVKTVRMAKVGGKWPGLLDQHCTVLVWFYSIMVCPHRRCTHTYIRPL
jgi:hypothetical protein